MREFVVLECPKCGTGSRIEVQANAYLGGWCIGPKGVKRHKPVNYQEVGRMQRA